MDACSWCWLHASGFRVRGADLGGWQPPSPPTFDSRFSLLATRPDHQPQISWMVSQFLHLPHLELHAGRAAEDRDRDLEARARVVDLLDHAVERGERTLGDPHLLADLKGDRGLRPLDALLHLRHDAVGFRLGDRLGLVVGAEKARDLGRVLDEMVGLVSQVHLHQHVAGKKLALGVDLLSAAHLHDLLGRHHDLIEQMIEMTLLGLLADRLGDLALEVRVGLDDVPVLVRHCRRLLQLPMPSTRVTTKRMTWSATRKKIEAIATITKTMAVVTAVSRRVGQVTFEASVRTSCMNLNGLIFAIAYLAAAFDAQLQLV